MGLRWALVVLLAASTVLFGVGVAVERSDADVHSEPAEAQAQESSELEGAHEEAAGSVEARVEPDEDERVLGVDLESTAFILVAVAAGLALAAAAATQLGRARWFLLFVVVVMAFATVFDVRELIHQLEESRTDVAVLAAAVAILHLAAAAVSARVARRREPGAT